MNKFIRKVQYVSDLHLERYEPSDMDVVFDRLIKPVGDILVICGDLAVIKITQEVLEKFFKYFSPKFKEIIYIQGNHEPYSLSFEETYEYLKKFFKDLNLPNIHFIENDEYILDDTVFLGTTLWSDIRAAGDFHNFLQIQLSISDYSQIWKLDKYAAKYGIKKYENIRCNDTQQLFDQNVKWLEEKLEKYKDKNVIVLSHHLPSFKLIAKKYEGNIINHAFASNLDYLLEKYPNIKYWISGHTHFSFDIIINKTRCLVNPAGYFKDREGYKIENKEYKNDAVVDIS